MFNINYKNEFERIQILNNIVNYIKEEYPDSCLAFNTNVRQTESNEFLSSQFLFNECEDFFYYEKLKWCGCGDPELVKKAILKYLTIRNNWSELCDKDDIPFQEMYRQIQDEYAKYFGVQNEYEEPLLLALAYTLDATGFTEHGSSISGCWMTDEGRMFLFILQNNPDISLN